MTLTTSDIKSICFGALRIEEIDGCTHFSRFTKEQEEVYVRVGRSPRERATSSVLLDFSTDSESISLKYKVERASATDFYYFDLYENDVMIHHEGESSAEVYHGSFSLRLGRGEKRVRLYMPWSFGLIIEELALDDGAFFRRTERTRKALILGDSITQGASATYPSLCYANAIIDDLSLDAINQGISGEIFRAENLGSVPVCDPEIITVAYGTNDWNPNGWSVTEANANAYFTRLTELYPKAKIIYISPLWRADENDARSDVSFREHCDRLIAIARAHGIFTVDGRTLTPHVTSMYHDECLHPNDLGFTQYARTLVKAIKNAIS